MSTKAQRAYAGEIKTKLVELQESDDPEVAHSKADALICELLDELGFGDIVEEYDEIKKWYA